jgi:hypothetical protein
MFSREDLKVQEQASVATSPAVATNGLQEFAESQKLNAMIAITGTSCL